MRKSALAVGAAVLIGGPTALSFFSGGFFDRPRLIAGIVAWALVLLVALFAAQPVPRSTAARVALAGLFLFTAWTALSLTWAPLGGRAQDDLQRLLLYLGFFIASLALLRGRGARTWLEPALVLGALVVVGYALSERLLPGLIELDRSRTASGRLEQPLSYWNALGSVAAIGFLLAVRVAGEPERSRALRGAAAAAGVALGLGVYLSFSRGALAAVAAGLVVLAALAPQGRPQLRSAIAIVCAGGVAALVASRLPRVESLGRGVQGDAGDGLLMLAVLVVLALAAAAIVLRQPRREPRRVSLPVSRPAAVLAVATVALLVVAIAATALEGRPQGSSPERTVGAARLGSFDSNRYRYWRVALESWADRPLQGVGSGGFQVEWRKQRERVDQSGDAHSLYVETAAELGLVGLALLLLFLGGIGAGVVRLYRLDPVAATGPAAALAAWAIHAGLDWNWEMPAVTLLALLLGGAALAWGEEKGAKAPDRARFGTNSTVRTTKGLLALVLVLVLAAPATALAQSAGDEQYTDPFQQENQGGQSQGGDQSQGGGQTEGGGETQGTAPAPPAGGDGTVEGGTVDPAPPSPTVTGSAPATSPTLPATGLPIAGLVALGAGLLTGGFALRRRA